MLGPPKALTRWGLLVTTLAMSAALVGTGLSGYLGARQTANSVTHALAIGVSVSTRQAIRAVGSTDSSAVAEVLSEMQPQGLRYLAIFGADGPLLSSAGNPTLPSNFSPPEKLPGGALLEVSPDGTRMRVTAFLAERAGMGLGRGRGPGGRWGRSRIVIEYDSEAARSLTSRARSNLIIGSAAAIALLLVAGVFWRLSRRAELAAAGIEHDRRLKMLGEMSAVLGHELRNPLTSLKGHAQLLLEAVPRDHAARDDVETVVREAVRLEDLAQQVLDFIRTGSVEREPDADPVAIARAAVEAIGEQHVRLAADEAPPSWPLDRVRVEQVLVNLLRNAEQASPAGEKIDLTVAGREGRLVYEVRDRGEGLGPGDQTRMFEPFYTTRTQGVGLGLAIARRIVEEHGGSMRASTHPDGGALFSVTIPRSTT